MPLLTSQLRSKSGSVAPQVDERTNTVFYQEAKSNITGIREFLARVDKPTRQVMIEARLVEVNGQPGAELRHQLGGRGRQFSASPQTFSYGGSRRWRATPAVSSTNPLTGQVTHGVKQTTLPTVNTVQSGSSTTYGAVQTSSAAARRAPTSSAISPASSPSSRTFRSFSATLRLPQRGQRTPSSWPTRASSPPTTWKQRSRSCATSPCRSSTSTSRRRRRCSAASRTKSYGNTLVVKPSDQQGQLHHPLSVKPEISNLVGEETFNFAGAAGQQPDHRHAQSLKRTCSSRAAARWPSVACCRTRCNKAIDQGAHPR